MNNIRNKTKFTIGFDIKAKKPSSYAKLNKAIESISGAKWCLGSQWFVETSLTASQIYGLLSPCIDHSDRIGVWEIGTDRAGQF